LFVLCAALVLVPAWTAPAPSLAQSEADPDFVVNPVLRRANFPVALTFAPDGRMFYTEKETGWVRVVDEDGTLHGEPVIDLPTDSFVERGMIGIALDPGFAENGFIWVYHTQPNTVEPPHPINKIVRFRLAEGVGVDPVQMLSVPITTRVGHHVAGNLRFDADGYLIVSIGDIGDPAFSEDIESLPGGIHRFAVVDDALIPAPNNPFTDNSTLAYGLRNPFDFDIDPQTGNLLATENGPTCDDEVNLILPGGNYGWGVDYTCYNTDPTLDPGIVPPLARYTPTEALTGILVYDGEMFPAWQGDVFFCGWKNGIMWRAEFNAARDAFDSVLPVPLPNHSCATDVEVAPDGSIVFTSFNAIYRITREDAP